MRRNRIEGLRVFNYVTGSWTTTVLAAIMATFDPVVNKLFILGVEFVFDGEDEEEGEVTLVGKLRDEDGHLTRLRIPAQAYERLVNESSATATV